ncbi:hypothetical protein VTL71DRAFT_3377 [Oculimacula yallundae]|uniref:Uncharacterized protein n=1 Tax=Oculimacula yallundae TaxID=86028 RepID=A0ABR4C701_9HELO
MAGNRIELPTISETQTQRPVAVSPKSEGCDQYQGLRVRSTVSRDRSRQRNLHYLGTKTISTSTPPSANFTTPPQFPRPPAFDSFSNYSPSRCHSRFRDTRITICDINANSITRRYRPILMPFPINYKITILGPDIEILPCALRARNPHSKAAS